MPRFNISGFITLEKPIGASIPGDPSVRYMDLKAANRAPDRLRVIALMEATRNRGANRPVPRRNSRVISATRHVPCNRDALKPAV